MKDQILDFEGSMPVGYKTIISQGFHSKKQLITLTIWGAGFAPVAPDFSTPNARKKAEGRGLKADVTNASVHSYGTGDSQSHLAAKTKTKTKIPLNEGCLILTRRA